MTPPGSRPTLEQVAAVAGVSRATVSRVVNGTSTVDEELAASVRKVVDELGYVPNAAARALMTRRVDTVALVATEAPSRVFGDPFFAAVARGASQELARNGLHMLLSMVQADDDRARLGSFLRGGHVDGTLVISEHDHRDVVGMAVASQVPVVVGGRPLPPHEDVPNVDHDNVVGGRVAAQRLREVGRRRVGIVSGPQDMSAGVDRLTGFREGMAGAFDASLVEIGDFTTAGGADATARLLGRAPDLDGLFVANDLMALGALTALRSVGRSVPRDVAVVGFDDSEVAAAATPPLTTVRQRTVDMGRLMAQLLVTRLGREVCEPMPELVALGDGSRIVLDVELVVRDSA